MILHCIADVGASTGEEASSPIGAIVGGIVGGLVLIVLVIVVIMMFRLKKACFASGPPLKSFDNPSYETDVDRVKIGLPADIEDDGGYVTMDKRKQ